MADLPFRLVITYTSPQIPELGRGPRAKVFN
jgi:hypothetical protein